MAQGYSFVTFFVRAVVRKVLDYTCTFSNSCDHPEKTAYLHQLQFHLHTSFPSFEAVAMRVYCALAHSAHVAGQPTLVIILFIFQSLRLHPSG